MLCKLHFTFPRNVSLGRLWSNGENILLLLTVWSRWLSCEYVRRLDICFCFGLCPPLSPPSHWHIHVMTVMTWKLLSKMKHKQRGYTLWTFAFLFKLDLSYASTVNILFQEWYDRPLEKLLEGSGGGGMWAKNVYKIFVQGKILWKKLRTPSSP